MPSPTGADQACSCLRISVLALLSVENTLYQIFTWLAPSPGKRILLLKRKTQAQHGVTCAKADDTVPRIPDLNAVSTLSWNITLIVQSGIPW